MAFGSAIHRRSSCTHAPNIPVKGSNIRYRRVQEKSETHSKRTIPTNDVPEILEEPLLYPSSFFSLEIPLVSWKVFAVSAIDSREGVKGSGSTILERTKNPRWVYRPWHIPDCRTLPVPSENHIHKDRCASRECSELILHG